MRKHITEFTPKILKKISAEKKLFLCCDYDGTLVSFSKKPDDTDTPDKVLTLLEDLNSASEISVAVLSGRSLPELQKLIPLSSITLAGLHGIQVKYFDGEKFIWPRAKKVKKRLVRIKEDLVENFSKLPGTIVEDKEYALSVHYRAYQGEDEEVKKAFYSTVDTYRPFEAMEILEGSKLMEIRPKGWHKGKALKKIRKYLTSGEPVTLYFGDDTTDEDAFRVLNREEKDFPVLISKNGRKESSARYFLRNPEEVLSFLETLKNNI